MLHTNCDKRTTLKTLSTISNQNSWKITVSFAFQMKFKGISGSHNGKVLSMWLAIKNKSKMVRNFLFQKVQKLLNFGNVNYMYLVKNSRNKQNHWINRNFQEDIYKKNLWVYLYMVPFKFTSPLFKEIWETFSSPTPSTRNDTGNFHKIQTGISDSRESTHKQPRITLKFGLFVNFLQI